MSEAGFEFLDHTAETVLRLHAPTLAALVVQSSLGFASLVPERSRGGVRDGPHDFEMDGGDRLATLVAWINELVYLAEAEWWIPVDAEAEEVGDTGIRVRARSLELTEPFVLVKAATLHAADIREEGGRLKIDVTLDI